MAAITMPSIPSLISQLKCAYPAYHFKEGVSFRWSPIEQTIYYDPNALDALDVLHEVAHALLAHTHHQSDVELVRMEAEAWSTTKDLAKRYQVIFIPEHADEALESYQEWLHARSSCPTCGATGLQTRRIHYRCLACATSWRVNSAKHCGLKRYRSLS